MTTNTTALTRFDSLSVLLIALAVALVVLTGRVDYSDSDPFLSMFSAQRIVEAGTLNLDPYEELHGHNFVRQYNGHYYDYFPPGTALFSSPFIALHKLAGIDLRDHQQSRLAQKRIAALVNALSAILGFLLARRWLSSGPATLLTVAFFFGSPLMSTMGTALWNMNFTVLWILAGLLILSHGPRYSTRQALALGGCLFAAYLCRPTAALFVLFVFALLLVRDRRALLWTMLSSGGLLLLLVGYSLSHIGTLLPPYYLPSRLETDTFAEALYGNTLSPSRGLLPFVPFLPVVIYWALRLARRIEKPLLIGLALWILVHLLIISRFPHWWGGGSYGPRFMTDMMPAWLLLSVLGWHAAERARALPSRLSLLPLIALALFINTVQGIYNPYSSEWNVAPNIDQNHQQVFDWRYPQFLHNAERHAARYQAYMERNGISQKSLFSADELNTSIAERTAQQLIVDNQRGFVFFGPYEPLLPGRYRFSIDYQYEGEAERLGRWDVVIHQTGKITELAAADWRNDGEAIEASFEVPLEQGLGQVEIRPFFDGNGRIQVSGLNIVRVE